MAAPTTVLTFSQLKARVGYHQGYGRTEGSWSPAAVAAVDEIVADGLRTFYQARDWGFLRPWRSFNTTAAQSTYTLPDAVGYLDGDIYFASGQAYPPVVHRSMDWILSRISAGPASGIPVAAAIRPAFSNSGASYPVNELVLWPTPSAQWTLTHRVRIMPDLLSTGAQYALGGAAHAQTILCACLAAAEMHGDDGAGLWNAAYLRELERSIDYDARAYAPRSLGFIPGAARRASARPELPADLVLEWH